IRGAKPRPRRVGRSHRRCRVTAPMAVHPSLAVTYWAGYLAAHPWLPIAAAIVIGRTPLALFARWLMHLPATPTRRAPPAPRAATRRRSLGSARSAPHEWGVAAPARGHPRMGPRPPAPRPLGGPRLGAHPARGQERPRPGHATG